MVDSDIIKPKNSDYSEDFFKLFLMSGPEFVPALYGGTHEGVIRNLYRYRENMTSYEHVSFAQVDGKNSGMVCAYDWRQNEGEQAKTTLLMIRYMKLAFFKQARHFQWAGEVLGKMDDGTYYIASMAVYPEHRSRGLGMSLLKHVEGLARIAGATSVALDAETYNEVAIRLYRSFGMETVGEPKSHNINGKDFEFVRMAKDL
ncbi:MAG: GNAT family N-acetyltransferase [Chloroflexota bacterium]|nr:GNAT family N-acetyltransferase [Chloroflexota bacterium]